MDPVVFLQVSGLCVLICLIPDWIQVDVVHLRHDQEENVFFCVSAGKRTAALHAAASVSVWVCSGLLHSGSGFMMPPRRR